MRPPKLHVTLLSAILVMRAEARVLAARIGVEIVGATFFAVAASVAAGFVTHAPGELFAWSAAALVLLVGAAVYFIAKVVARVGAIAEVLARVQKRPSSGLVLSGIDGFPEGVTGTLVLFVLDLLGVSCVWLTAVLAGRMGHGTLGAIVAAATVALVAMLWWVAQCFGTFAFVLGAMDGDGVFAAWPRALRLVLAAEPESKGRMFELIVVTGLFGSLVFVVDFVSSTVSSVGSLTGGQGSFVIIPILTLCCAMLIDMSALVSFAALTDRLPLGFATPIVLASPRAENG